MTDAENAFFVRLVPTVWVARVEGDPYRLSAAVQEQVLQATGLPVNNVQSMNEVVRLSTARQRFKHAADGGVRRDGSVAGRYRNLRANGVHS